MVAWKALGNEVSELGESPYWQASDQRLYWVDIAGRAALRANPVTGATERWQLPSEPGCIAPAETAGMASGWVLALRSGIYRAQQWGGALTCIARLPYDPATQRANDGKCDPQGRLWVGTRDEQGRGAAAMYRVDAPSNAALPAQERAAGMHGTQSGGNASAQPACVRRLWNHAGTVNGLGWSPDQRTLYSADTPTHRIEQRDWNAATGEPAAPRTFHAFAPKPDGWEPGSTVEYGGRPDGAAVDQDGNYWCALYEGGRVVQLSPTGALLREIAVPVVCPSMVCLGGPEGRTLFVTTVRHGRSAVELARTSLAGRVLMLDTPVQVPGLPVNPFREAAPLLALGVVA